MNSFKRIRGLLFKEPDLYEARLSHLESTTKQLQESNVPVSDNPCRTCADPCEFGHPDYPARFGMDVTSELLGSLKPYHRQVVISTGKSNWEKEVTEAEGSLAQQLSRSTQQHRRPSFDANNPPNNKPKDTEITNVPGIFSSNEASRLSILNGSHYTLSDDDNMESVLVFPDYKVVKDVERSQEGADLLWRMALDPGLNRAGRPVGGKARSWPLSYACVILLCSHKRRDNRCHIAAPKLQTVFTQSLESEGYEVHTQLEDPHGPSLEEIEGSDEDREKEFLRRLQGLVDPEEPKKALILKNSHVGGHKFSGNVVIYTPQGSGVWYGRVSPHEVPAIVKTTFCEGKVLPALLRGGVNLTRPQGKDLLSW
ncbi:Sucrase/ferredoxin-like-domain-containing protein [Gautieria morchelliformis]|nr:Sucrase/ferredoxin-like-domain-containing protein [Gautieria morchelliformis]